MSSIEWTDATWNPVVGCRRVSEGCRNCYAERMAARVVSMSRARNASTPYERVVRLGDDGAPRPLWNGRAVTLPERLADPLRWRKPRRVFVNSMSDLFHEDVPDEFIAAVFGVMAATPQHTYQVLTKRPARAVEWLEGHPGGEPAAWAARAELLNSGVWAEGDPGLTKGSARTLIDLAESFGEPAPWPLPNVWLGVSVEDQATADERIPLLLDCPAAVRFVSYEPALGPVDFAPWLAPEPEGCPCCRGTLRRLVRTLRRREALQGRLSVGLDWIIVGGESGPDARRFELQWARDTIMAGRKAGVPVFVKQLGACASDEVNGIAGAGLDVPADALPLVSLRLRDRKGGDPAEWPAALRAREFPGGAS